MLVKYEKKLNLELEFKLSAQPFSFLEKNILNLKAYRVIYGQVIFLYFIRGVFGRADTNVGQVKKLASVASRLISATPMIETPPAARRWL